VRSRCISKIWYQRKQKWKYEANYKDGGFRNRKSKVSVDFPGTEERKKNEE